MHVGDGVMVTLFWGLLLLGRSYTLHAEEAGAAGAGAAAGAAAAGAAAGAAAAGAAAGGHTGDAHVFTFHPISNIHHVPQDAMDRLYRENMDPDFAAWRDTSNLTMEQFHATVKHMQVQLPDCYKQVLLYKNTWYYADQKDLKRMGHQCPELCNGRYVDVQLPLSRAMNHSLDMPDVLFLFNVCDCDQRHCSPANLATCQVPVFQMLKYAQPGDTDTAILLPLLEQQPGINLFPWELKQDKGFFRGSPNPQYGPRHFDVHLRAHLANLSRHHPDLLDVALVYNWTGDPLNRGGPELSFTAVPFTPMRNHSLYRYLLNMDGVVASYRFSKLLSCDSIILKSFSHWIEFYYRSLKPGVNYFSFMERDLLDVLEVLPRVRQWAREQPGEAQAMILRNLHFFQTYLTLAPRLLYWQEAMRRYSTMIRGMPEYIQQLARDNNLPDQRPRHNDRTWTHAL